MEMEASYCVPDGMVVWFGQERIFRAEQNVME